MAKADETVVPILIRARRTGAIEVQVGYPCERQAPAEARMARENASMSSLEDDYFTIA